MITEIKLRREGAKLTLRDLEIVKRIERLRRTIDSYRKPVYCDGRLEYRFNCYLEVCITGDIYALGCMLEGFEGTDVEGNPTVFGVPAKIIKSDEPKILISTEII